MAQKKYTLFELHLDGNPQLGIGSVADAVLGGEDEEASAAPEERDDEAAAADEETGGPSAVGVVVGLLALVAIAVAVRKFRSSDEAEEEPAEQFDEPDVVVT